MNNKDVFERVLEIMNYIVDMESVTVKDIADYMKIPEDIVCDDLKNIIRAEEMGITIYPEDDEYDTDDFLEEFYEGKHNDVRICAGKDKEECTLTLNLLERTLLEEMLTNSQKISEENIIIKKLIKNHDENNYATVKIICDAISNEKSLDISYNSKNGIINVCVSPLKIIKMVDSELFYMVAICENEIFTYRVDRIKNITLNESDIHISKECSDKLENFDFSWGTDITGEKFKIKLRVTKEAGVYNKMFHELRNRRHGKWTDAGEYYIYDDIVIGETEFMAWIRKYGYSVIVLEPIWIAEKILDSAKKRYEIYNDV